MSHRLTKEELDAQFEQFLKESVSDDSIDLGSPDKQPHAKTSQKSSQKPSVAPWQDDDHSSAGTGRGLLEFSKSFRKSLRNSQPIREEDEYPEDTGLKKEVLNRDSTETEDSGMAPVVNMTSMGVDTLEEEEEKARFFAQLEAGALSTIDYSKLNRDLDSTSYTIAANLGKAEDVKELSDGQSEVRVPGTVMESPAFTGSPHYSDDFEDDKNVKKPLEEKCTMSAIFARVSLYASLDETGDRRKDTEGSLDKELPTEEELMRPIRPEKDQIRGFTLQPVSAVEFNQEKESQFLDKTDVPHTESQLKKTRKSVPVSGVKGARGHASHQSRSPDPPKHDLTSSIKEEVERLMQDQNNYSSYTAFSAGKAKKQQASHDSTVFKLSTPSVGKPTAAAVRGKRVDERIAIAPRLFGPSRAATTTAKTHTSVSRFPQHPRKTKFTNNQEKDDCDSAESGLKVSSELVASVQSLVAILQQQMDTSTHQDAAQEIRGLQETRETRYLPQFNRDEQSSVVEELKVQLAQKERELQVMKKGAEELSSLRQQNFLLQSKVHKHKTHNK